MAILTKLKYSLVKISIFLLIVVAIVLGYIIYTQSDFNKPFANNSPQQLTTEKPTPQISLSENDVLLKIPGSESTLEEKKQHYDAATKIAKDSNSLSISQCQGNPAVIRIQLDKILTIDNPDSIDHSIIIDKDNIYNIPANGKKEIVANFGQGNGLYGYTCDVSQTAKGLILIIK